MIRVRVTVDGKLDKELDVDREMTIGRKAPADIVVTDGQVSSRHAKIRPDGERLLVTDLGSTNGTRIDGGERLAADVETPLERTQKLLIGTVVIEIVSGGPAISESGFGKVEKTVAVGQGMMQSLLVQVARFKAAHPRFVLGAEHSRKTIEVTEMEVVIGREPENAQVVIPHQSVSSKHARLRFSDGRFMLDDLGSANGTFVSGVRIAAATPLEPQTAVTFGTIECLFVAKAPEAGGSAGGADPLAELLTAHSVRMGRATEQQARDALAEHRTSGRTLGEIFVERGIFTPRDWAEVYRNRQVIATLQPAAAGGKKTSPLVWIVIAAVALAAMAVVAFLMWRGGGK